MVALIGTPFYLLIIVYVVEICLDGTLVCRKRHQAGVAVSDAIGYCLSKTHLTHFSRFMVKSKRFLAKTRHHKQLEWRLMKLFFNFLFEVDKFLFNFRVDIASFL